MATANNSTTVTTSQPPPAYRGPSPFGNKLLAVTIVFTVLAIFSVSLRLFTRIRHVGRLAADDWTVMVSLVLLFGFMTEYIIMIEKGGLGWPDTSVSAEQSEYFYKVYYFNTITYCLVSASYKFSVLLLYKRIFTIRWFSWVIKAALAFVTAWLLVIFFTSVFIAWPINYNWEYVPGGHYDIDLNVGYWGLGISNLVIDGTILLLPIPVVWRLKISLQKKILVIASFLLGGLVVVCSLFRLLSLESLDDYEVMGTSGDLSLWSYVEVSAGIVSACLPTILPLFKRKKASAPTPEKLGFAAAAKPDTRQPKRQRISDPEMMTRALVGWGSEARTQGGTIQSPSDRTSNQSSTIGVGRSWYDTDTIYNSYRNSRSPMFAQAADAPTEIYYWRNNAHHINERSRSQDRLSRSSSIRSHSAYFDDSSTIDGKSELNSKRSNASSAPSKYSGFSAESLQSDISPTPSLKRRKSCSDTPKVITRSLDDVLRKRWQEEALAALEGVIKEVRIERQIVVKRIQM